MTDIESVLYFYSGNINDIPQTEYSLQPMGCLMCNYETNVGSNLVSHLKKHRVEADDSTKSVHKSITYNLNSIFTPMDMINSSTSSSNAQENEKVRLNAELHSANKQKSVDKYIQSTQYNYLNVPEALASVTEPSNTIAGFKKLPSVKHTNLNEQVPSTQYNMFNISNALVSVAELSTKISGFKDLQPTNKKKNVDQHIPSTQNSMFNISEALDSVAELLARIARFKDLPPANKQTNVDEQIPSTQYNILNVPEALASVTESSATTIVEFKYLQPTNKQKNVDLHISSTQNSMFNFLEALDCVAELLSTIAGFKEIPIKSTTICSIPIKTIDVLVSEVQEKILSYHSRNPNG